jgi:DNA-binding transcriptional MerR regulator
VTLRDAADATAITVSTVRNWARKGRVSTKMEDRVDGPRRMVDLASVLDHARALGRVDETAAQHPPPAPPEPVAAEPASPPTGVPEGQMLVPLDAWEKMLMQLGNLHEAGQQLADARERAAKAETEAAFLRERIADLRTQRDELRDATPRPPDPVPSPPPSPPVWTRLYRQWQRRRTVP